MFSWSYRILLISFSLSLCHLLFNLISLSQSMIYISIIKIICKREKKQHRFSVKFPSHSPPPLGVIDEDDKHKLIVEWFLLYGVWHHRINLCVGFRVIRKNFTNFTDMPSHTFEKSIEYCFLPFMHCIFIASDFVIYAQCPIDHSHWADVILPNITKK